MSKSIEVVIIAGLTAAAFPHTSNAGDIDLSRLAGLRDIESGDILIAGVVPPEDDAATVKAHFADKLDDVPPAAMWFMLSSPVVTPEQYSGATVTVL